MASSLAAIASEGAYIHCHFQNEIKILTVIVIRCLIIKVWLVVILVIVLCVENRNRSCVLNFYFGRENFLRLNV